MIKPNALKAALARRQVQLGMWSSLSSPYTAELLAGAGYDWMNIDMEHSPNDLHSVLAQLQAIAPYDVEPVVRLIRFDKDLVKQYLDLGVRTLMLPNIDSVDEAQAIVQATRYAPQGIRGVAGQQRANRWGRVKGYHASAAEQLCIVVQIESPAGVAQARAIADVDGIDALFVGPNDLAAAMGQMGNPSHPSVQAAIAEVQAKVTEAGKPTGILAVVEADAQRYIAQGYRMVGIASDQGLLVKAADELVARFRKHLAAG